MRKLKELYSTCSDKESQLSQWKHMLILQVAKCHRQQWRFLSSYIYQRKQICLLIASSEMQTGISVKIQENLCSGACSVNFMVLIAFKIPIGSQMLEWHPGEIIGKHTKRKYETFTHYGSWIRWKYCTSVNGRAVKRQTTALHYIVCLRPTRRSHRSRLVQWWTHHNWHAVCAQRVNWGGILHVGYFRFVFFC